MKKTAVVFDSAGTLVEMYRVALDMSTGTFIPDSDNLRIVSEIQRAGLVVLDTPSENVLRQDPECLISDYLEKEHVHLGIVYSNEFLNPESISLTLKKSKIPIGKLQYILRKAGNYYDDPVYSVSGFIADIEKETVPFLMSTGGALFPNARDVVENIRETGADIYIASGDDKTNVLRVGRRLNIPDDRVYSLCRAENKKQLISGFQNEYDLVIMVGDGINDLAALRQADIGILISRKNYYTPDSLKNAADVIITDLGDCCSIIRRHMGAD
ncbi:HAD-IC family P-type ATPase [Methanosarcinaceae archaeon]|nr:HAD-IC family P-type ATPase [Methanosarcinaceae archaeon]